LGKKSSGDLVEFIETGKDSQSLSLEQIVKLLTEQKEKFDFHTRKRNCF
jgi:hypothetical protein